MLAQGIDNVCISPGSRNTPLTTAFAENKKIKKHVIIDERSSGFFALGLAKVTGKPVGIITTSGTATANLYPAVIEAYLQRIPLIICTADRPAHLRNTGANQTINQVNLYKTHIRYFRDIKSPALSFNSFKLLYDVSSKSISIAQFENRGPVHLNFQFEKPLEKTIKNIAFDNKFFKDLKNLNSSVSVSVNQTKPAIIKSELIINKINKHPHGLILVGWDNYSKYFLKEAIKFSRATGYPILTDGASGLFLKSDNNNIIVNYQAFLRSKKFLAKYSPKIILQFGNAPTSNAMLDFIKNTNSYKVAINTFGDRKDSGSKFNLNIRANPEEFCRRLSEIIVTKRNSSYLNSFIDIDNKVENLKNNFLSSTIISEEIKIINSVIESLPTKSNLFVSNSLPIRDLEFFKSKSSKQINLFVNRGASGIDGITSTAAGIAAGSKFPTVLVTGDLSLFHDTNGLHTVNKYKIPLTIILINNDGGAIFGMLPVVNEKTIFDEYFFTSTKLNFSQLIKTYGGNYTLVSNYKMLQTKIQDSINKKHFTLLEIKTDYKRAIELRKKYFKDVVEYIDNLL